MFGMLKKILKYPRLTQNYPKSALDFPFYQGKPEINSDKCTGCGECIARCPSSAVAAVENTGKAGINYDECIFCFLCEDVCPANAISVTNKFELAEKERSNLRKSAIVIDENSMPELPPEEFSSRMKDRINKVFGRSLQIREVDAGSCNACDYEINALNNPFNDIERLGIHFVASPRHADMLLVTGTATRNMEQALLKTYLAAPDPKLVVAVGACACSGGIFRDAYAAGNGIDNLIPVDVYVPGCPPRPQAIMYGILKALDRVR